MEPKNFFSERIQRPTESQVREMASKFGFNFTDKDVTTFSKLIDANLKPIDRLAILPDYLPEVKYPRVPGHYPSASENKLNAWYVKTTVKGASEGKLSGKKIVLKDNICLAGVPMMNGSSILEGYTPEIDATVVTRILDAGGIIVGKAHCENLCISGSSFTGAKGPVHNPHKYGYVAGGSSAGTAALVGAGEVEMGIGGDQGGSIRIPASWCGCVGMKATHGLVPYTGIMPIEITLDHVGPITNTVADNALLLEVIAGPDGGLDPRQYIPESLFGHYTHKLKEGVKGMKIGIVKEGFGHKVSEELVDRFVRKAAEKFKELGATVEEVSIPEHLTAVSAFMGIFFEGTLSTMLRGNGFGTGYKGLYLPSLMKAQARWKVHPDQLSQTTKLVALTGEFLQKEHDGIVYAKGQNLSRVVRKAFDEKFKEFDILIMPTLPYLAPKIPEHDIDLETYVKEALSMIINTSVFDCTGHPAMSLPIGKSDDLPIGMMLIGKHYNESTIYKAGYAWEQAFDWKNITKE